MCKKRELKECSLFIVLLAVTFAFAVGGYGLEGYKMYNSILGSEVERVENNKEGLNIPFHLTTRDYAGKISVSLTLKEGINYKDDVYALSYRKTSDTDYKVIYSNIKFDKKNVEKLLTIADGVEYGQKYDIRLERVSKNSHKSVVDMYVLYD